MGRTYDFQKKQEGKKTWFEVTIEREKLQPDLMSVKVVDTAEKSIVEY